MSLETAVLALAYVGDAARARQRLAELQALASVGERSIGCALVSDGRCAYLAALAGAARRATRRSALGGYRRAYELRFAPTATCTPSPRSR